jgi:hypothetical protein
MATTETFYCELPPVVEGVPNVTGQCTDVWGDFDDAAAAEALQKYMENFVKSNHRDEEHRASLITVGYMSGLKNCLLDCFFANSCSDPYLSPETFKGVDTSKDDALIPGQPPTWSRLPKQGDRLLKMFPSFFVRDGGIDNYLRALEHEDRAAAVEFLNGGDADIEGFVESLDRHSDKGPINVAVTGTMHNMAVAIRMMSKKMRGRLCLWVSGGWKVDQTTGERRLGYNLGIAPQVAAEVFDSGVRIVLVPPEVGAKFALNAEQYADLLACKSKTLLGIAMKGSIMDFHGEKSIDKVLQLGDVITMMLAIHRPKGTVAQVGRFSLDKCVEKTVLADGTVQYTMKEHAKGNFLKQKGENMFEWTPNKGGNVILVERLPDEPWFAEACRQAVKDLVEL